MAGHNKWSKVKHRKAVVDKRRSKAWSRCAKAIIVAAKHGGGDPDSNVALRYAIDEARYHNMPNDNIDRAIRKGLGADATENYEAVRYEGYGPGGAAILIDSLTDNRTRTVTDLRLAFTKHGGSLGNTGSVAYLFQARGRLVVPAVSEDRLMEAAIAADAADVRPPEAPGEGWVVLTDPARLHGVKLALERAGFAPSEAALVMLADTPHPVPADHARKLIDLIDAIEDCDDVQKVYTNADISDEVLATLE